MNSRAVINVGVATFSLTVVLSGFWEKQRAVSAGSGESFRSLQGFATSLTIYIYIYTGFHGVCRDLERGWAQFSLRIWRNCAPKILPFSPTNTPQHKAYCVGVFVRPHSFALNGWQRPPRNLMYIYINLNVCIHL